MFGWVVFVNVVMDYFKVKSWKVLVVVDGYVFYLRYMDNMFLKYVEVVESVWFYIIGKIYVVSSVKVRIV